jgi:hypothetical protein
MTSSLRVVNDTKVIYEGEAVAVPRVGDAIHHDGQVVRVESVVWDFAGVDDATTVTLHVGSVPYTF